MTNQSNLNKARTWIDENLEQLVCRSILADIDPPLSLLLHCLDKPVNTKTGLLYADILKKQFSLALNQTTPDTANSHPPQKHQATIIDYDSDMLSNMTGSAQTANTSNSSNPNQTQAPTHTAPTPNYTQELLTLKH